MARFELQGANVLVTGASRGIGPYIASALAEKGARVALLARSAEDLAAVARHLSAAGADVIAVPADVTQPEGRVAAVSTAERELGPLDILVNNAGGDPQREFHHLSEGELESVLDLNLGGPVMLVRLLLPGMLERGRGHVVNISSMAGRTSFPHTEAYAAGKEGLIGFTRVLRGDYRRHGVSASSVIVGPVREAGVGARTAEEFNLKLPPFSTVSPAAVAKAVVRSIVKDKAEIAMLPGPGRSLRALLDRFPGLGPALNRVSGGEATMRRVAEQREREHRAGSTVSVTQPQPPASRQAL